MKIADAMTGLRFVGFGSKNGSVRARAARPFYPQEQTSSACPDMSVWCQGTKSLRSSPLRGSKSREAGSELRG